MLVLLALAVAARGLARHTTWYLASDQFAFLTFAADLAHGRVLHDATMVRWLSAREGGPPGEADAYYLTYIWRDGRLFSRYPPGFPMLLAGTGIVAGERGQHALNPVLYLVLLAALALLAACLLKRARPTAASAAAAAAPWLLLVLPTTLHQWGITIARDLPAHLLALAALLLALRGRLGAAGIALGFAASVRPDAVLWGIAIGAATAGIRRPGVRDLTAGTAGFVAGALPLFAYNAITQGHPLAFSQGSEFRSLFVRSTVWPFGGASQALPGISGGGFRIANIPSTLPGHLWYLGDAFGALAIPAAGALGWALLRHCTAAAALGAYVPIGVLFYSCWGRPDPRYLVGVVLCLLGLTALGVVLAASWLADPTRGRAVRLGAAAGAGALALLAPATMHRTPSPRLPAVEGSVAGALAVAAIASVASGGSAAVVAAAPLLPAVALATVGLARVASGGGARDPFQRAQVDRARASIESLVPADALVLTTPSLGRPGENIAWYTHAEAHYLGELRALESTPARTAAFFLQRGRRVFLLLDGPAAPPAGLEVREVARREGEALLDWFVDPRRAAAGAVLHEVIAAR